MKFFYMEQKKKRFKKNIFILIFNFCEGASEELYQMTSRIEWKEANIQNPALYSARSSMQTE